MDLKTFFEHFDTLAEAPNGIQRLRELILDMAVRGKLVPQDPGDEPAEKLIQEIKEIKGKLHSKKRSSKKVEAIEPSEDIVLPDGWAWSNLQELGEINPKNDLPDDLEVGFVPMKMISTDYRQEINFEINSWASVKKGFTHFADGDVGIAKITPCFQNGKGAVFRSLPNGYGSGTTELLIFRPVKDKVISQYILLFLKSRTFVDEGVARMTGTAGQQRVPRDYFAGCPFPLPPLAEQKRIVAKVDELMGLCDALEAAQQNRNTLRQNLRASALDALMNASCDRTLETSWAFVRDNWRAICDRPEDVEGLRQVVLQTAFRGKLGTFSERDEHASKLLREIENEKDKLARAGKIKTPKKSLDAALAKVPFNVPENWIWVCLEKLTELITKGSSPKWQGVSYVERGEGIRFITSENVRNLRLDVSKSKYVESRFNDIEPRSILQKKDLLVNIVGASIGRTAIFELDEVANINQAVCVVRLLSSAQLVDHFYILYFLNSPICVSLMLDKQVDNARANLSMGNLAKFPIPLPPLAEQKRIVAKVDELMQLCDQLEESLRSQQQKAQALAASAINHLAA